MDVAARMLRPAVSGRSAPLILLGLLVPAVLSGCRDAVGGDPMAVVVAPETRGSLRTGLELPSLPDVVERIGESAAQEVRERRDEWVGRWEASWLTESDRGRSERRRLYRVAAEPLARDLGPDGVRATLDAVEEALGATEATDLSGLPSPYLARLDEARRLLDRGRRSLRQGRTGDALRSALGAADRIRALSPESVARALLRRAREAREDPASRAPEDLERIDRLLRGAESALEKGDHRRAVHRAFYACRLLGVELPGN